MHDGDDNESQPPREAPQNPRSGRGRARSHGSHAIRTSPTRQKTESTDSARTRQETDMRDDVNEEFAASYGSGFQESTRRFIVEDVQDLAKIGGDLLKRTMSSGFEMIKEVKEGLPKEASHLINKGREEIFKGLSKEVLQNVMASTIDRVFSIVREHKLDVTVSVRLKKADDAPRPEKPRRP